MTFFYDSDRVSAFQFFWKIFRVLCLARPKCSADLLSLAQSVDTDLSAQREHLPQCLESAAAEPRGKERGHLRPISRDPWRLVLIWNIGGFCILTWNNTIKQSGAIIASVLKTSEVPKDPHACFIRHRICRKASGEACLEMKQPPNFSLLSSDFFEGSYRTKRERPVGSTLSGGVKHMACRSDLTWALPGSGMLH